MPLHAACANPYLDNDVVEFLMQQSPTNSLTLPDATGYSPLYHVCSRTRPVCSLLDENETSSTQTTNVNAESSLLQQQQAALYKLISKMLPYYSNFDGVTTPRGWTLLHAAARQGWCGVDVLQLLIQQNPNQLYARTEPQGWTPLHVACGATPTTNNDAQTAMISFLAQQAPTTLHQPDATLTRSTPVEYAVRKHSLAVVRALLEPIPNHNDEDSHGQDSPYLSPHRSKSRGTTLLLHLAAQWNPHVAVLEYLCHRYPHMVSTIPAATRVWSSQRHSKTSTTSMTLMLPLHWACATLAPLANIQVLVRAHPVALMQRDAQRHRTPLEICQTKHGAASYVAYLQTVTNQV
uniref:Uncharacterized protein n=1 Tax=Entomoneis paludosa TaxID=265537 RepID=A0A7S3DM13_9STRA